MSKTNKLKKKPYEMTFTEKVAAMSGCSERYARQVLDGKRKDKSAMAQRIVNNASKVMESDNKLLCAVKELIAV